MRERRQAHDRTMDGRPFKVWSKKYQGVCSPLHHQLTYLETTLAGPNVRVKVSNPLISSWRMTAYGFFIPHSHISFKSDRGRDISGDKLDFSIKAISSWWQISEAPGKIV
jgi:hypothetical protein